MSSCTEEGNHCQQQQRKRVPEFIIKIFVCKTISELLLLLRTSLTTMQSYSHPRIINMGRTTTTGRYGPTKVQLQKQECPPAACRWTILILSPFSVSIVVWTGDKCTLEWGWLGFQMRNFIPLGSPIIIRGAIRWPKVLESGRL